MKKFWQEVSNLTLYKVFCVSLAIFGTLHILQTSYWNVHIPRIFQYMVTFRTMFWIITLILLPFRLKTWKEWIYFACFYLIFLISMDNSGIVNYLVAITFIFFVRKENINLAIKYIGLGMLLGLFLVVVSAMIGVLPNNLRGARNRQNLGFRESVMSSLFYLNFIYVFLYLNRDKLTLKKVLYIFIPGLIIFLLSDGRMSFVLMTFVLIALYLYNKFFKKHSEEIAKFLCVTNIFLYWLILFSSIFAAANFHNSTFIQSLNSLTTGRMEWFSLFWESFDLTWLGQRIPRVGGPDARATGQTMMVLDSGYLNMIIRDGIIPFLIISYFYFKLMRELYRKNDVGSLIIWSSITLGLSVMNGGLFLWGNPLIFQFTIIQKSHNKPVGGFMKNLPFKIRKHYKIFLSKFYWERNPKKSTEHFYEAWLGEKVNLENPKDFNEKIMWLKHNHYWDNQLISNLADKYEVRKYISDQGLEKTLNEIYGLYESVEEIDWNILPNKFALKCTHGSQTNIICKDKKKLNKKKTTKKLSNWMKEVFGKETAEFHYRMISPRIICEKFLPSLDGNSAYDYKFHCVDGEIIAIGIYIDRSVEIKRFMVDEEYQFLNALNPENKKTGKKEELPPKPKSFSEMIQVAQILSKGFPYVRVDLYDVDGKVIFGELTFTPNAGKYSYIKQDFLDEMGRKICLN